jgi:hypothetical protein
MDEMCRKSGTALEGSEAAADAMAQSASAHHWRGGAQSARTSSSSDEDGDAALRRACEEFGQPGLFPAPSDQELRDLDDSRNRSRGQKTRRKRLDKGWHALQRAQASLSEAAIVSASASAGSHELSLWQPVEQQLGSQLDTSQLVTRQLSFQQLSSQLDTPQLGLQPLDPQPLDPAEPEYVTYGDVLEDIMALQGLDKSATDHLSAYSSTFAMRVCGHAESCMACTSPTGLRATVSEARQLS